MSVRRDRLDIGRIIGAARTVIDTDGFHALSMRRLGAELGVDPMAIYRHVADRQALLAAVLGDVMSEMAEPDESLPWQEFVRAWGEAYWETVTRHRELFATALGDPAIASGARLPTDRLIAAVAASGVEAARARANAYLVIDFTHGSALGSSDRDEGELRSWFRVGLETIIAGMDRGAHDEAT